MSSVMEEKNKAEQVEERSVRQVGTRPTQQQVQGKQKKRDVRGFVNSPWLLLLVPLIVSGFYFVLHPQYIVLVINYPYAFGFILSLPVCVFAIKLVINFFSVIEQWIRLQFEKARQSKKGYFFELVTAVFMFVSVCEAGPFFNDIQHNVLGGALGYITVLAFDLIAVVCIDARRKEVAKGGTKSGVYLTGVIICAAVSMVANLYSALLNFQAPLDPTFPSLLKFVAPYVGIMFPIMIVFLAFSRDTDIEIDDAVTYRKQQQKRVDFLVVRREILEKVTREMERIDLLKQREVFLRSWLFPRKKILFVIDVITSKVKETISAEIATLREELQQKEQTINEQVHLMESLANEVQQLSDRLCVQEETVAFQLAEMAQWRQAIDHVHHAVSATVEQQLVTKLQVLHSDVQRDMEQQITTLKNDVAPYFQTRNTRVKNSEDASQNEQESTARLAQENPDYGLNMEEKQLLITAFPALESWFLSQSSSMAISEIVDLTALRQVRIMNAVTGKKIKPAKGRDRVQTESFLRWLLQDVRRAEKRTQRSARPLQTGHFLEDFLSENKHENVPETVSEMLPGRSEGPQTEELKVIHFSEQPASFGDNNGHGEEVQDNMRVTRFVVK